MVVQHSVKLKRCMYLHILYSAKARQKAGAVAKAPFPPRLGKSGSVLVLSKF